jgi:hypothetical protein
MYNLTSVTPVTSGITNASSISLASQPSTSQNITISPSTRHAVGNYTVVMYGYLKEAPSIYNTHTFTVEIIKC